MKQVETIKIGMRDFLRNPKKIKQAVASGQRFEVLDRATPAFLVVPPPGKKVKKYTQDDVEKFQFAGKHTDLAQRLDDYLYGEV